MLVGAAAVRKVTQQGRVFQGNGFYNFANRRAGSAILLNGVLQTANREIGVPGFQPQVFK